MRTTTAPKDTSIVQEWVVCTTTGSSGPPSSNQSSNHWCTTVAAISLRLGQGEYYVVMRAVGPSTTMIIVMNPYWRLYYLIKSTLEKDWYFRLEKKYFQSSIPEVYWSAAYLQNMKSSIYLWLIPAFAYIITLHVITRISKSIPKLYREYLPSVLQN